MRHARGAFEDIGCVKKQIQRRSPRRGGYICTITAAKRQISDQNPQIRGHGCRFSCRKDDETTHPDAKFKEPKTSRDQRLVIKLATSLRMKWELLSTFGCYDYL